MSVRTSNDNAASGRVRWRLPVLSFVAFVIGTAELMVVGLLDLIAADTGVSIGTAGRLVTGYALGIAVGAPIISALMSRFDRRVVLGAAMATFLAANLAAMVSASFQLLVLVRILTGSLHGLVAGVATALAASLVEPEHRGRAIAMVVGGITVSTVVGVPIGTLIGQALGWRAAFGVVVVVGIIALGATLLVVPPAAQGGAPVDLSPGLSRTRAAFAPRVLAILAMGVLLFTAQFTAFTYLTPFLAGVTGISGGLISTFLLAYGVAATAGTGLIREAGVS